MAYQLEFEEKVLDALEDLGRTDAKLLRQVFLKILSLRRTPAPQDVKQLQNFTHRGLAGYRVTQGDYRIIYAVNHPRRTVYVALVIKRGQGYRELDL